MLEGERDYVHTYVKEGGQGGLNQRSHTFQLRSQVRALALWDNLNKSGSLEALRYE